MSSKILCYGKAEVINRIHIPYLPTSERDSEVTAEYYRVGGSALNVAIPLALWGLSPVVSGSILGEDVYADLVWRELQRHPSIDTRWLQRSDHARTPFTRLLVLPDRERFALRYWHGESEWTQPQAAMFEGVDVLSIDVEPGETAVTAARMARKLGLRVIATDVIHPNDPLAGLSDAIITSFGYLRRMLPDLPADDATAASDIAVGLQSVGAGTVIVSNGSDPIQVIAGDGARHTFASFPLPPVDRLGAGDVFKAAYLLGDAEGWDLERTVRFGAAAASLWIAQPTPIKRPPTPAEVEALLAERAPRLTVAMPQIHAGEAACPLCQRIIPLAVFERHWQMEPEVVAAIHESFPGWRRADGACPICIHEQRAIADRRARPKSPLLVDGHPIYGTPDLFVLPTPVRLRANPHYSGRGITICMLDSGFYPHPDLTQPHNRIRQTVDATTTDIVVGADFREPRGVSWHGLMTSAAAAGNGALSQGRYAGIASEAEVILVKISDPRGRVREKDIIRGLRWVLDNHRRYEIDIVNISVGGDKSGLERNAVIDRMVGRLVRRGVIVVAAAGNAGQSDLYPPASAAEAITVGGIDDRNVLDETHRRMYGSNWGRMTNGDLKPEVVAPSIWLAAPVLPGTRIAEQNLLLDRLWWASDDELPALLTSTHQVLGFRPAVLRESLSKQRARVRDKLVENKFVTPYYQHVDGTSFAAPIVSSVVAQMLEANPDLSPDEVKALIIATAERLPNQPEERQGHGVITPGRAVAAALRVRYGALDEAPLSPYQDDGQTCFLFYDERAAQVAVIGDFNNWQPAAMTLTAPGRWTLSIPTPAPGRYHYKYLIDGERWIDDPENSAKRRDGYGGFDAVLVV
ncbi:MAG: S8 family serine peptidase [Caldilineales bacterium]|nr:S8 family serine peptidase [Caldilineales bacterium]